MLDKLKKNKDIINIKEVDNLIELECDKNNILSVLKKLKENDDFIFDQLLDITAVDNLSREYRFDLVYIIQSLKKNKKLILKTSLKENDTIETIISVHKAADWYERECYDLFGIEFKNHPDLRRIMTDYNFEGHPLRKDFPLSGYVEVRYDEIQKRVVCEPIELSQEYRDLNFASPWDQGNI